jgi:hypothetical protein
MSGGIGEAWRPFPARYQAEVMVQRYGPEKQAPEFAGWVWCWTLAEAGRAPSIREVVGWTGWGKTKAARVRQSAVDGFEQWTGTKAPATVQPVESKTGGTFPDRNGTPTQHDAGHNVSTSSASQPNEQYQTGQAGGTKRDDRGRVLLSTPTPPSEEQPPNPPADAGPLPASPVAEDPPPEERGIPKWVPAARTLPSHVRRREVLEAVVHAIELATQRPCPNPLRCGTNSKPILSLLRKLEWPPLDEWLRDWDTVCEAARECPDPLFARDLRAIGWDGGVDRSHDVATLAVQQRWDVRVLAANDWVTRGRPRGSGPGPPGRTRPETSMDRQLRELTEQGFFDDGDQEGNRETGTGAPGRGLP